MMYFEPENSPWGQVDHCETICPGVYSVSTPGHGGIMVRADRASEILSASARRISFREHGYLCFEEDCDAPVALRELMDQGLMDAPVNNHFAPGEYSRIIDESLQRWHPKYWEDHKKGLTAPRQKQPKERER